MNIVRRSTNELAQIKDLHSKDKEKCAELFDATSNKIKEKIDEEASAQAKKIEEDRKTHKRKIEELEGKLKSAQLEKGKLDLRNDNLRKQFIV